MNRLLRDPLNYKAVTLQQAIDKHEVLLDQSSGASDWAFNIIQSTKDLLPEFQDGFIRYLANPGGGDTDLVLKAEPPAETYPEIKVIRKQGNVIFLECESLKVEEDDEKLP
jgi:hypothetical protein